MGVAAYFNYMLSFFNIIFVQKLATLFHLKGVYTAKLNILQLKVISSFGNAKGRNKYSPP